MNSSRFTSFSDLPARQYEPLFIRRLRKVRLFPGFAVALAVVCMAGGCVDNTKTKQGLNTNASPTGLTKAETQPSEPRPAEGLHDLDLGQDWSAQSSRSSTTSRPSTRTASGNLPRQAG